MKGRFRDMRDRAVLFCESLTLQYTGDAVER